MNHLHAACAIGALLVCAAPARVASQVPGTAPFEINTTPSQAVMQAFGVRKASVQGLEVPANDRQPFELRVVIDGSMRVLRMRPHSMFSADYKALVEDEFGIREIPAPIETTYQGDIVGIPGSSVALSIWDGTLSANILLPGKTWTIQPVTDVFKARKKSEHLVYELSDVVASAGICGQNGQVDVTQRGGGGSNPLNALLACEIALDCQVDFYRRNGSNVAATIAAAASRMNKVDIIYRRDVTICYRITSTLVRTTKVYQNGPQVGCVSGPDLLEEMRTRWNANHRTIRRDVAHMLSGWGTFSGIVGCAYVGVICSSTTSGSGYGVSRVTSTNDARNTGLVAHEIGHNWNASHCSGSSCRIMCASLGGCSGNLTSFGAASINTITAHKNSRTCLSSCQVTGTYSVYGSGCGGAASAVVVPSGYTSAYGNSNNSYPFGWANLHYMQAHDATEFPGATIIRGFELRNRRGNAQNAYGLSLLLRAGHTARPARSLLTTFASNWKGTPTTVFNGTLNVPSFVAQTNPNVWTLKVPFSTPVAYLPANGNFLWEALNRRTATSPANFFDAVSGTAVKASRLYNNSSYTATTGTLGAGYAVITKIDGVSPAVAAAVVPAGYATTAGNSANSYPFGWANLRYMQAHAAAELPATATLQGMAVRNRRNNAQNAKSIPMTIYVGHTTRPARSLATTFASNWAGSPTRVFNGTLNVPAFAAQTSASVWTLQVPFSTPFVYSRARGNFLFEAQNRGTSTASPNYFDAVSSTSNQASRLFNSSSFTATTGTLGAGYSVILQLQTAGSGPGVRLTNTGVPTINQSFNINLSNAASSTIGILYIGGTRLNASLGAIAPGCSLYTSLDILLGAVATGASGAGTVPFALPNNASLVGLPFYNQWIVIDRAANNLGLTFSNGGAGKIGG